MIEGHETEFSAVSKYNPIHFICTDEKGSRGPRYLSAGLLGDEGAMPLHMIARPNKR